MSLSHTLLTEEIMLALQDLTNEEKADAEAFWLKLTETILKHIKDNAVVSVSVNTTGTAAAQTGTGTGSIT